MIAYAKKNEKLSDIVFLIKKKKKPGLNFNPVLSLTGVQTTGPRAENWCGKRHFLVYIRVGACSRKVAFPPPLPQRARLGVFGLGLQTI